MGINEPQSLKEAEERLHESEKTTDHLRKINCFDEGVEILDDIIAFAEENDLNLQRAENLKISYTRSLINNLDRIKEIEIDLWFRFFITIFIKMKKETQNLTEENPNIKKNIEYFKNLISDDILSEVRNLLSPTIKP